MRMRDYFNPDSYITQLNLSQDIVSCDPVPLPDIAENSNYIFISYAHRDYRQVYADLAVMYHAGVRFWYDRGLAAGKNWETEAKKMIENPHCVGVIFFLSENLFLSESVNKEIDLVRGKESQARKNYFCVNLSSVQPSHILRNIMRMDDTTLDLAGLTMERIAVLANAFDDRMTYLRFSDPNHRKDLIAHIAAQFNVIEPHKPKKGILVNSRTNEEIPITEDTYFVGRMQRKCHYCVTDDSSVSVVHFSVISSPDKTMIMDFGATNGTYVNNTRIPGMTPVPLRDGDEIAFGNQLFVFRQI